jgi:hypothetical protein
MADLRGQIFGMLEDAGRGATGGVVELTLRQVYERLGGKGSHATRIIAEQLGVTQRQAQRYVTEAGERRAPGRLRQLGIRNLSRRELLRAGAAALRREGRSVIIAGQFELCYQGKPQGNARQLDSEPVELGPDANAAWLDHFDAAAQAEERGNRFEAEREYDAMEEAFDTAFLDEWGGVGGGEVEICPDGADFDIALS